MKTKVLTISAVALSLAALTAMGREQVPNRPAQAVQPQAGTESTIKSLESQEHAWAESCRSIAAIYRQMAASSNSDSPDVRELKRQYTLLAENEEKAAAAADKMAAEHAKLLESLIYRQEEEAPLAANVNPEK